jgi:hypothetical protein
MAGGSPSRSRLRQGRAVSDVPSVRYTHESAFDVNRAALEASNVKRRPQRDGQSFATDLGIRTHGSKACSGST